MLQSIAGAKAKAMPMQSSMNHSIGSRQADTRYSKLWLAFEISGIFFRFLKEQIQFSPPQSAFFLITRSENAHLAPLHMWRRPMLCRRFGCL